MKKPFLYWCSRSLVILLLFSMTVTCLNVAASPAETNVFIDPPYKEVPVNQTFSISVSITDVVDLYFWEFKLWYTTANVNATSVTEGPFLKAGGAKTSFGILEMKDVKNATHGLVWARCGRVKAPGVNGGGVLAVVSFKATSLGSSDLLFLPVRLENSTYKPIACTATGGTVEVKLQISPYGPKANFTVSPAALYARQTLTFNALASKAGSNGTQDMPIAWYYWDFGDESTSNETNPITTHTYAKPENYTVTLTVCAPGATPETDTTTSAISLISPPTVFIDPPLRQVLVNFTFTVSVRIANVTNLYGYEFKLYYNTTVLDATSFDIPLDDPDYFLKVTDQTKLFRPVTTINDTLGYVWIAIGLLAPELPRNGSGTLATITFKSTALGSSNLTFYYPGYLYPAKLSELQGKPIFCIATSGTVNIATEVPPFGPTARFTIPMKPLELGRPLYAGESLTFNASASEAGCNGTHIMPIAWYYWDFGDGSTSNETDPIATHTYAKPENYTVTLTVCAPGATPETDTTTATIRVVTKPEEWGAWVMWIFLFSIIIVATVVTIFFIRRKPRPRETAT